MGENGGQRWGAGRGGAAHEGHQRGAKRGGGARGGEERDDVDRHKEESTSSPLSPCSS